MEDHMKEPAYSVNVLEFIRVAHEYCQLIEKADERELDSFLDIVQKLLPLMYLKGLLLPIIDPGEESLINERMITEEEYESVFNNLRAKFGKKDIFYFMEADQADTTEPIRASLAENLSDLYQDLKDFLFLYQKHSRIAKVSAAIHCRNWFEHRWGLSIMKSSNYLHTLTFPEQSDDYSFLS